MMIAQPEMIRSKIGVKRTKGPQHHQSPRCYSLESASTPAQKGCNSRNYYLDFFFSESFCFDFYSGCKLFSFVWGYFLYKFSPDRAISICPAHITYHEFRECCTRFVLKVMKWRQISGGRETWKIRNDPAGFGLLCVWGPGTCTHIHAAYTTYTMPILKKFLSITTK